MFNPLRLFLSFNGRIGRFAYWFGLLVLLAASPFSIWTALSQDPFKDAIALTRETGLAGLGWTLALLVPLAALNTKRLHDLGQSGLLAVLFYAPAVLSAAAFFTGWQPQFADAIAYAELLAGWLGVAGAWFLVRLGFFPGTAGDNKYGMKADR